MIPPFNEFGYLPPGVYPLPELRRVQMESLHWMIELAIKADVQRIILNGSFVTDTMEPEDVDCVLLAADITRDLEAEAELDAGLPFLAISLVGLEDFDELVNVTNASDRDYIPKGMVEVIAWR